MEKKRAEPAGNIKPGSEQRRGPWGSSLGSSASRASLLLQSFLPPLGAPGILFTAVMFNV